LSGSFAIDASVYALYSDIVLAFKVGEGQLDPDWAGFLLTDDTLSGRWSVSGSQQLSHAIIYGKLRDDQVPEPGSVALVGLGLIVAGWARRSRKG
jgi:hypothetical protein